LSTKTKNVKYEKGGAMLGGYVIIWHEGKELLFLKCPTCGHLDYIPGKKKSKKVHVCWGCGELVEEP